MDNGTTINLFGNPKTITNRLKEEIPMNFLNNAGSKIVDKVGYIFLEEGKQFHPEMISNVPSLNEIT